MQASIFTHVTPIQCAISSSITLSPWFMDPRHLKLHFLGMIYVLIFTPTYVSFVTSLNLHSKYFVLVMLYLKLLDFRI
uniref:Putative ovule protein n=1 Tax=Solanum chacoense TaxID=4108 RepID=A0A0V0GNZ1_SOLCH